MIVDTILQALFQWLGFNRNLATFLSSFFLYSSLNSINSKMDSIPHTYFFYPNKHFLLSISMYLFDFGNPRHAVDILNHESFTSLSEFSVREIISRDSFCAEEVQIFR